MKKSAVRERILEVASRLFYEQGYNLTGINQIIEEADIARASLYNHFESKTHLLLVYLKEAEDIWFTEMENFTASFTDPKQKLLALFDFRMERQSKRSFGGCQFIKISAEVSRQDSQVFDAVSHQKNRLKVFIVNIIKDLPENNQTLTHNLLGDALFLLLEGAAVSGSIYKNQESMKTAKEIADKLI
ncbi:TetR/AcrR family transcriptional regulator [Dyadobacter frigoris]|uniref:TetR/AcrR family transcriptional regulator n=1 Tax=Dyadobacter frigoris TaxID=2576211 RepID=A0A4U6CZN9_9BACT|nr:TetR/AcrR family transcriptional regulator [Dyadobacter frigoris]TKT89385.1 TetR/AcrR family transcriptional regulator [Dyadobacter frigoris]GLU55475.1 TetR family transcriptional regulator [Dyadobacter frigoris]